jgi:hypothetical protein
MRNPSTSRSTSGLAGGPCAQACQKRYVSYVSIPKLARVIPARSTSGHRTMYEEVLLLELKCKRRRRIFFKQSTRSPAVQAWATPALQAKHSVTAKREGLHLVGRYFGSFSADGACVNDSADCFAGFCSAAWWRCPSTCAWHFARAGLGWRSDTAVVNPVPNTCACGVTQTQAFDACCINLMKLRGGACRFICLFEV